MSYSVGGVERQTIQAGDDRQPADRRRSPCIGGRWRRAARRRARCPARLRSRARMKISTTSRAAPRRERSAIPLGHHQPCRGGCGQAAREILEARTADACGSPSARIAGAIAGGCRLLQPAQSEHAVSGAVGAGSGPCAASAPRPRPADSTAGSEARRRTRVRAAARTDHGLPY